MVVAMKASGNRSIPDRLVAVAMAMKTECAIG